MLVKKIITSSILASLGCSSTVLAAGMFPNEWKESKEGIYQVYFEGQFVHQSDNLATANAITVPTVEFNGVGTGANASPGAIQNSTPLLDGDPNQDWGFGFGLGYVFASKKYDVRAHYFGLRSDRTQSTNSNFIFANPVGDTIAPAFTSAEISEKNNYDFTEADITFGNFIHLSHRLTVRLGAGLEFADIKQHSRSSSLLARNATIVGMSDATFDQSFTNKFKGVGPLFTIDGQYDITKYIAVVGAVGASALYGTSEADYYSTSVGKNPEGELVQDNFAYKNEEHKIALGLDSRLGLRFSKVVSRNAALNVEAGYEGFAYLNALQDGNFEALQGGTAAKLVEAGVVDYSFEDDYNNYGPYVRIGVDFK